ncbi:uncharacterized protein [Penaeus vannamei]|uniref:uncharacterized protein n=1 Tax=Penaeus vannamei TaxID=6689 RepID=UPI00387F5DF9
MRGTKKHRKNPLVSSLLPRFGTKVWHQDTYKASREGMHLQSTSVLTAVNTLSLSSKMISRVVFGLLVVTLLAVSAFAFPDPSGGYGHRIIGYGHIGHGYGHGYGGHRVILGYGGLGGGYGYRPYW